MKIKSLRADIKTKADDDGLAEGEFLVYPSTFIRTPDSYGDVVAKGAFARGIASRKEAGVPLPGLYGHRLDDPDYFVAHAIEEGEDEHGWWVKGAFDMDSPKGPHVYRLVKSGRLRELSFAFDVRDEGVVELEDGTKANELRDLDVFEFSFVPVGANRDTSVVSVKSAIDALTDSVKTGRLLSAKNSEALAEIVKTLDGALDALKNVLAESEPGTDDQERPNEPGAENDDEAAGQKSDESRASKSARALAINHIIQAL